MLAGNHPRLLARLIRASSPWTSLDRLSRDLHLHGRAIKSGFVSDPFVSAALLRLYSQVVSLNDVRKLFYEIPEPGVVSWNTLISAHVRSGEFRRALGLFGQLGKSGTRPDAYSFTAALTACGQLGMIHLGLMIHSSSIKAGVRCSTFVSNCLIDMYGKCGRVEEAISIFNGVDHKDTISWNSVIAACSRNQRLDHAICYLHEMPSPDTISYNEVISGIAQFGKVEDAYQILSSMPDPNSSSWSSIIAGCVNRGWAKEALTFFVKMHSEGMGMDQFTFSSILCGIAALAKLPWGMVIHSCTIKYGLDVSVVVGTALIDMYAKCGKISGAELVFQSLPKTNLISWNALISGFSRNGNFIKIVEIYKQLQMRTDIKPDSITFLNILSACSHCEVPLEIPLTYFKSMMEDYGIEPSEEHCCSMIRVMGQKGDTYRAMRIIEKLGFESSVSVWKALLGACETCRDLETAKVAAFKLIDWAGDEDYVYVTISNICASHGKWKDVGEVRKLMNSKGVRKGVGFSWIEVDDTVSTLV